MKMKLEMIDYHVIIEIKDVHFDFIIKKLEEGIRKGIYGSMS